ncbi:outer membrane protein assembly factor BamA [Amylibacter sp. IMCC11727]|uniref:outer membrane protein assembly factor BamA n=1 Tax=Amylibacter sp. IMCC11727 TaxID=3039851 RepID=UPI00244DBEA7|nr:outer membrane protein assembly factor BamA [Amylibacter sp. IMCC11727]WGI20688.1 outer membrane protein assembly factor BamA [Amylibacter sp. IMCC11727]
MITSRAAARFFRGMKNSCAAVALATAIVPISGAVFVESSAAYAQASARFSRIDVSGNQRIASDTIRSIAGISAGVRVTPGQINGAVQNLFDSGLFESVDVRPERGRLVIEVVEYPTINVIAIEGNRRLKDEDLLGLIGSVPRRAYSPLQAEADTLAITNAYAAAGRLAARVEPKIIRRSDNRVDLVFEVREGRVVEVNRISFTGNRQYSDRRLRRTIDSKQAGLFRAFVRRDTFIPERLEFDKEKLRNFYLKRGYIDADVVSSSADFARERNSFGVNFQVQEGQQYTFGEMSISSPEPDVNIDDYNRALRIRSGSVYNPEQVNTTLQRMDIIAAQKGLPFVQAQPRVTRNDDTRTLDIDFELVRGPKLFIERIDIEGNSDTLDRVIRREFESIEGDPFNARKVQEAADRIRALGFFARVDVQTREGSGPDQVVIDVNVEEQPTGTLGFGLGFGTDDGLGGNVNLTENNFLGRGQSIGLTISTTSNNREFSFNFVEPKLFDRDLALGMSVSYRTTDNENLTFDTTRLQFVPSLSFPIGEFSRLSTSLVIAQDEVTAGANSSALIQQEQGSRSTFGFGLGYTFDRRNSPVDPTAGFIFSFDQTLAGIAGDNNYYKAVANAKTYRSLFNEEVILSAEFEGGYLKSFGGESTSIIDRFQLGGNTLRGFESFGIGPRNVDTVGGTTFDEALGGNFYALARLEASFPIGLPEEYGIHGGLFFDVGSVWGLDRPSAGGVNASSADFELRSAIGVSIFWDTAIGPLRFNFAKPLEFVEGVDNTETFNFTIDTRF